MALNSLRKLTLSDRLISLNLTPDPMAIGIGVLLLPNFQRTFIRLQAGHFFKWDAKLRTFIFPPNISCDFVQGSYPRIAWIFLKNYPLFLKRTAKIQRFVLLTNFLIGFYSHLPHIQFTCCLRTSAIFIRGCKDNNIHFTIQLHHQSFIFFRTLFFTLP